MNELTMELISVDEHAHGMATDISNKVRLLDGRRKYLFMKWLLAHFSKIHAENVTEELAYWLRGMSAEDVAWEYKTILNEIEWWHAQKAATVDRLILEHFVGRRS
jgi:hypothetical protein